MGKEYRGEEEIIHGDIKLCAVFKQKRIEIVLNFSFYLLFILFPKNFFIVQYIISVF